MRHKLYKKSEFENTILNHRLQLSMWRVDDQGVTKIDQVYFSPSYDFDQIDTLKMRMSIDNITLMITSQQVYSSSKQPVLLFNVNTLEKIGEMEVERVRAIDQEYDKEELETTNFRRDYSLPIITGWAQGDYLLVQITTGVYEESCYGFDIVSSETGEVVDSVLRTQYLADYEILQFREDAKKDDVLYVVLRDPNELDLFVVKWNPFQDTQTLICTYKGFSPTA